MEEKSSESSINPQNLNISKYSFLFIIYLVSVVSSSVANSFDLDVQILYRIPFINLRWIDISIILILVNFIYKISIPTKRIKDTNLIITLCFLYLLFESIQLIRTWGQSNDINTQTSHFLCTIGMFIIIDLSVYEIPIQIIVSFIKKISIWGAVAILISNSYLLYSFINGHIIYTDSDIRVGIAVSGSKETVYSFVLTPFVYAFGLYFIQKSQRFWVKTLFLLAIFSIYGALVITFWRGTLVMVLIITVYFLFNSKNTKQIFQKFFGLFLIIVFGYILFGGTLANKGYDPITKISEIVKFSTDINNPGWDKGRSGSQEYAIKAWKKHIWFGTGYKELSQYGLPEDSATAHNGIITSLFHRGIFGTLILLWILVLLFSYAIKLWYTLNNTKSNDSEFMKLLILVTFCWIITFMTQEALWEKYSLSIEFTYLGLILNYYKQEKLSIHKLKFK